MQNTQNYTLHTHHKPEQYRCPHKTDKPLHCSLGNRHRCRCYPIRPGSRRYGYMENQSHPGTLEYYTTHRNIKVRVIYFPNLSMLHLYHKRHISGCIQFCLKYISGIWKTVQHVSNLVIYVWLYMCMTLKKYFLKFQCPPADPDHTIDPYTNNYVLRRITIVGDLPRQSGPQKLAQHLLVCEQQYK